MEIQEEVVKLLEERGVEGEKARLESAKIPRIRRETKWWSRIVHQS